MQNLNSTFLLLSIFILVFGSSCNQSDIEKDMVYLDKKFIPVLYYSNQNDFDQAAIAMDDYKAEWKKINTTYQNRYKDEYWKVSFQLVDVWVEEIQHFITHKDAENATAALHQICYQLNDVRFTHHIDNWLEPVWDLQMEIKLIVEVATDSILCQNHQDLLYEFKGDVDNQWQILQTMEVNTELFELDNNEISNLIYQEKQFNDALNFMGNSIDEKECDQISIAANRLKQSYFEYLSVFGEFRSFSDAIALQ